jgi:hypothetical protein
VQTQQQHRPQHVPAFFAFLLQAARIPCDADSITEMIKLMDANCDGCISWDEFEKFMMSEFAAGQQLLSGEFVLPSGEQEGGAGRLCFEAGQHRWLRSALSCNGRGRGSCLNAQHDMRCHKRLRPCPVCAGCLPAAGTALPFGAMVRQLKRNQMMKDVTEVRLCVCVGTHRVQ